VERLLWWEKHHDLCLVRGSENVLGKGTSHETLNVRQSENGSDVLPPNESGTESAGEENVNGSALANGYGSGACEASESENENENGCVFSRESENAIGCYGAVCYRHRKDGNGRCSENPE